MPYLTPNAPVDSICRGIVIPVDNNLGFLPAVNGALLELTYARNWEKHGDLTPEQCAEYMRILYDAFTRSDCDLVVVYRRIFRFGVNGKIQFSDDGGDSWSDAEEQLIPPLPARTEPTDDEKRCLAARNAAEVLYLVYLGLLDAWETDGSIAFGIGAFAAILGLVLAGLFLPVAVITALISFALGAFGYAYGLMEVLTDNDWIERFTDDLTCLLYENASVNAGVVRFDYMAVRDNLFGLNVDPALRMWLFYILQIIGAEGLNAAGATTAISEYNCDGCDEPWCYKIDFTLSDGGWAVKTAGRGMWVAGQGWKSSNISGGQLLHISRDFMPTVRITRIDSDVSYVYGSHSMNNLIRLWLNGEQTGTLPPSWGACNQATHRLTVGDIGHPVTCDRIDLNGVCYNERGGCSNQGAAVGLTVHSITIYGVGYNPFGTDNCGE